MPIQITNAPPRASGCKQSSKVCRVRFFVNGDRFFPGLAYVVNLDRLRTLDFVCVDLSRLLVKLKSLPSGVRIIFRCEDGKKIAAIEQLENNGNYACSSNDHFVRLDYTRIVSRGCLPVMSAWPSNNNKSVRLNAGAISACLGPRCMLAKCLHRPAPKRVMVASSTSSSITISSTAISPAPCNRHLLAFATSSTCAAAVATNNCRSKIVALLRGACRGPPAYRPTRRAFRFLLTPRIALNFEQLINEISKTVKLNAGAVHKVHAFTSGRMLSSLSDFWDGESIYLVYGRSEKCSTYDYLLDESEHHEVQAIIGSGTRFLINNNNNNSNNNSNNNNNNNNNNHPHKSNGSKSSQRSKPKLSSAQFESQPTDSDDEEDEKTLSSKTNSLPNFYGSSRDYKKRTNGGKIDDSVSNVNECDKENIDEANRLHCTSEPRTPKRVQIDESGWSLDLRQYHTPGSMMNGLNVLYCTEDCNNGESDGSLSVARPSLANSCKSEQSTPGTASSVSCSEDFSFQTAKKLSPSPSSSWASSSSLSSLIAEEVESKCSSSSLVPFGMKKKVSSVVCKHNQTKSAKASQKLSAHKEVEQMYKIGDVIGDGKFGIVYKCEHRVTKKNFALKVVNKLEMQQMLPNLCSSESDILNKLRHPNIIRLFQYFDFPDKSYLVLELFKHGDLFDAITMATCFEEQESAKMMNDLLQAVSYLHECHIVHRDIKLENLMVTRLAMVDMVTRERRSRLQVKLADFGLAVQIRDNQKLFVVCGTPTYVSPEILLETGYSYPVDVWACGVIAYILLSGFPPFANEDNDQDELFDQILAARFDFDHPNWEHVSASAKQLITGMLTVDCDQRLRSQDVLAHDWLRRHNCPP